MPQSYRQSGLAVKPGRNPERDKIHATRTFSNGVKREALPGLLPDLVSILAKISG
jgi:hypothetical protein